MAFDPIDDALTLVRRLIDDIERSSNPPSSREKTEAHSKKKKSAKVIPQEVEFADESALQFAKANLVVARVASASVHPEADRLLCLELDVGSGTNIPVVAGLRGHVETSTFVGQHIVAITNLKPCKLAGRVSEAMVLAASCKDESSPGGKRVSVLQAPPGSRPGCRIRAKDKEAAMMGEAPKTLSSKIWTTIVSRLAVKDSCAMYDGCRLETDQGNVTVEGMEDGAEIH